MPRASRPQAADSAADDQDVDGVEFALIEVRQPGRRPLVIGVGEGLELGRDCDGLMLADAEASRRHAAIRRDPEGRITVSDLGSTNGTLVNGVRIDGPTAVSEGDVVRIGATEVVLLHPRVAATVAARPERVEGERSSRATVVTGSGGGAVVRGRADTAQARKTSIEVVAKAVDHDHPDMANLAGDGGTITIVFSDIESSTEMAMALGDTQWVAVLRQHNDIVRRSVNRYGGTEIKSQGDGFMLTFPSARSAVRSMIDVQRELLVHAAEHADTPIRVRIGIHTGEAIVGAGGDLFGKHIIVAARIANLAEGGQILASAITKEIASTRGDLEFGTAQDVQLKGIEGSYQVYDVVWEP
jgi:adenylate cyclase